MMRNNYFDDLLLKNRCNRCNDVTNAEKLNNNNELNHNGLVTPSSLSSVTCVTNSDHVTPVTPSKKESVTTLSEQNYLTINKLDEFLHLLHLLHQKNSMTCLQEDYGEYGAMFDPLTQFFLADWDDVKNNPVVITLCIETLQNRRLMTQGIAPPNFTAITHCYCCGDVYVPLTLVNNGNVIWCMWCFNRLYGLPIPRPNKQMLKDK
jgi:hypothetical protein